MRRVRPLSGIRFLADRSEIGAAEPLYPLSCAIESKLADY